MPRLMLACAFVLAIPAAGVAAPVCVTDTLANYIALGLGGCSIGTATLGDFSSAPSLAGGTEILAADITVTPTNLAHGHQLDFGLAASAGPGDLFGVLIGYSIDGFTPRRADLVMAGSAAGPPLDPLDTGGVVSVVEDLCLDGSFGPFPSCSGTPASQIVIQDALGAFPNSRLNFGLAPSFFDVFVDIAIDGGTGGTASLNGPVTARFVPEPASMLLFGTALVGIYVRRRRALH